MTELLIWLLRLLAGLLVLVTLLPLLRVGSKYVRCWDFPRLQIAVVCGGVAGAILAVNVLERSRPDLWILACLLVACGLWQLGHVLRYSRFWPEAVRPSQAGDLRLLVSNLDFRNHRHVEASNVLEELDPDVLLLIEIDDVWREALQDVRRHYPDRLEHVRGEGLGLALWSKWPIEDGAVEHLVSEKRASLHATLVSPDGLRVPFVGLHPPPPGLERKNGERYDSRIRDAELVKVADRVAADPEKPWIVAGDFNDVAWSHTTRLFERISGLLDPRVGRRLLNTYHARRPLLRYPLDHVFLSPSYRVRDIQRIRLPGSDHFAVLIELTFADPKPAQPEHDAEDRREAKEAVEEGHEEARENGEAARPAHSP